MKQKILKLCTVVLLLLFIGVQCTEDDQFANPNVEFKFNLIDNKEEAKTIFKEGENFTFQFLIQTNDPKWRFNKLITADTNFFRIYRKENDTLINAGIPYLSFSCSTLHAECGYSTPFKFELPWITGLGTNDNPDMNSYPPFCMFIQTENLTKGNYVTYFDEQIEFIRCGDYLGEGNYEQFYFLTDPLHFEINFQIN